MNEASHPEFFSHLGAFLAQQRESIIAAWMDRVAKDPRIPAADRLSKSALADHIPAVLEELVEHLRSKHPQGDLPATVAQDAKKHGIERWQQGYRLEELLWEITQLRGVFIEVMSKFETEEYPISEVAARDEARTEVHFFLDNLARISTQRYVDEQQAELKKLSDSRLHLMRTVSHELRNVLNGLGLTTQSLYEDEQELSHLRDVIGRSVQHMKELLDDLLELSSLVSNQRAVRITECSPAIILHDINTLFTPLAEAKGLGFTASCDPALKRLNSDQGMIKQIATNLVSNAIKYTEAGRICLEFRMEESEKWAIVVTDTGVGIAPEEHEQIFSDLYRVEKTAHLQGIGLGLSIVSRLVELLNGTIRVESEAGKGSRFEVILPQTHVSEPAS